MLNVEHRRFAQVCVEIDLTQSTVVHKIWLKGHWYRVEYEGVHLICSECGRYGHLARNYGQEFNLVTAPRLILTRCS